MPTTDPYFIFTDRLNLIGARYVVTGSVACMIYGDPRLTRDVDVVLELPADAIDKLADLFPPDEFYCPPPEVIRVELARRQRGHFNLIHHDTGYKADIYLRGSDARNQWALDHAIKFEMDDHIVWIAPPESVILSKLEFYREGGGEKHLLDIRGILQVSAGKIDRPFLEVRITELGLQAQWKLI
ncbi:MAG TPA: hypothetical protein VL992_16090 [Tepidisphaeraceae bacterium]|nr:hypothetical protein [Tepidisphaeraceae bacterium]